MELIRNEHFGKSGVFTARPGRSAALGARLLALVEPIRIELGGLRYDIHRSDEKPEL